MKLSVVASYAYVTKQRWGYSVRLNNVQGVLEKFGYRMPDRLDSVLSAMYGGTENCTICGKQRPHSHVHQWDTETSQEPKPAPVVEIRHNHFWYLELESTISLGEDNSALIW